MKQYLNITIFLILYLVVQNSASPILPSDEPYAQWGTKRLNFMKNEPEPYIYGWEIVEVSNIQKFLTPLFDYQIIVVLNDDSKFLNLYERYDVNKVSLITQFKDQIPSDSQIEILKSDSQQQQFQIAIAEQQQLKTYQCTKKDGCSLLVDIQQDFGDVSSLAFNEQGNILYIGSASSGLFSVNLETKKVNHEIKSEKVKTLAFNKNNKILAANTGDKLVFYDTQKDLPTQYANFEFVKSFLEEIYCLEWRLSDNTLWVGGQGNSLTVFEFKEEDGFDYYLMWNVGAINGLPLGNVQEITVDQKTEKVYLKNIESVMVFDGNLNQILSKESYTNYSEYQGVGQIGSPQSPWRFFKEIRWFPKGDLTTMALNPFEKEQIFVSAEYGMAILESREVTLQDKADFYEEIVRQRFHELGIVGDRKLSHPGDYNSSSLKESDNQGMWNNMYLAAQAYRYKVEKSEEAKEQAWKTFRALERSYNVIPPEYYGLMAKAVLYADQPLPDDMWHYSENPGYEEFMYKENASSDDVTSYFYAVPLFMEYVCETQEEKDLAFSFIKRTMDYIMENGYVMINIGGEKTHWGFWNPENLNDNPEYYSERTLNSLEILGYLATVYKYSGEEKYLDAFIELGEGYGYLDNLLNWRNEDPRDVNFSDDELGNLAFHTFFFVKDAIPEKYHNYFEKSLIRSWSLYQMYQPSWYTYQTLIFLKNSLYLKEIIPQLEIDGSINDLQTWPLEMVNWAINNQGRQDLNKMVAGFSRTDDKDNMTDILNRGERPSSYKWNNNPYTYSNGGDGTSEDPPTPWLLAYYSGLYANNLFE